MKTGGFSNGASVSLVGVSACKIERLEKVLEALDGKVVAEKA